MINLRNSPFLWFALLLLATYQVAEAAGTPIPKWTVQIATVVSIAGAWLAWRSYLPGRQFWSTIAITLMVVAAGYVRFISHSQTVFQQETLTGPVKMTVHLVVSEVLKRKEESNSLRCKVLQLEPQDTSAHAMVADKYILVSLRNPPSYPLFPGDKIEGSGWVVPIQGPMNPHAFDLRTHYKSMAVRHRLTCRHDDMVITSSGTTTFWRLTAKWQYALSSIVHNHTSPPVAQLTNALVWGDRSDMDQDVIDAFADSGAMHVLSVSGMHVAMIYSMLYFLLGPPGAGVLAKRLGRMLFYISAIVFYMALTGASAAVVRAGWMIILFVTGKAMGWNTQIYNLLGFAAFVMLWINPLLWHNIGFQLSFLAMVGLLLYTKPISRLWSFKSIILQRTWEICAVSIAAQAFILPLLLSKFHQFPLTFIASSLAATPAGYVIIFGALVNVTLSAIGIHWLWPVIDKVGAWFIQSMKWMAGLNPEMHYALPSSATWLLMAMVCIFSFGLIYKWQNGKRIALLMSAGVLIILGVHRIRQWQSQELIIYHTFQGLLLDVIIDGHSLTLRDSAISPSAADFSAKGHRSYRDIIANTEIQSPTPITWRRWTYQDHMLFANGLKIFILTDTLTGHPLPPDITHVVIDQCQNVRKTKHILCEINPVLTILPAHLRHRDRSSLIRFMLQHEMRFHDIAQAGYFQLSL